MKLSPTLVEFMRSTKLRLQDIEERCLVVINYCERIGSYEEFFANSLYRDALLYELTIIGEASAHVDREMQEKYPDVPWREIKEFRNVITHNYFGVIWWRVWEVATERVPELLKNVRTILREEYGSGD